MHLTSSVDYRPLALVIRDTSGAIIAGLTAFTWSGTLRILTLWVQENWRRHGYGTRLLSLLLLSLDTFGNPCSQAKWHSLFLYLWGAFVRPSYTVGFCDGLDGNGRVDLPPSRCIILPVT
jgi:GNAT superfamily N-acetyltransferase